MARFSRAILLIIALCWVVTQPSAAQSAARLVLQPPDLSAFPSVSLTFEAYDAQGRFLNNLAQNEVRLEENSRPVALDNLTRVQPGMHVILAFNVAPGMASGPANGPSQFERLKQSFLRWSDSQPLTALDQFSLVTNAGPQASRLNNPAQFNQALLAYTPDLAKAQPSLTSLTTALDLASDPSRKFNSKRAVVYITAPLPDVALAALPNLAERAGQLGVRIFTWLVLPQPAESRSQAALADLAQRTGGQALTFSGSESPPDPEAYFQSMRYVYRAVYPSAIRRAGAHAIRLSIARDAVSVTAEQQFTLNLQPPNPFFLSPPTQVQRSWTQPSAADEKAALTPNQVDLQTMVEFPDGLRRPLQASRLYVDGQLVVERTAEPFMRLSWPLPDDMRGGQHLLRVEIEDVLGLTGSSIEIPVEVRVDSQPGLNLVLFAAQAQPYLPWVGAALLGGGGLAALGAALRSRLKRRSARLKMAPLMAAGSALRRRMDVPSPVHLPFSNANAPARLVQMMAGGLHLPAPWIALAKEVTTLGSDPRHAGSLLESPTVDGLHARICRTSQGQFIIRDVDSVAGTWVNHELVPPDGKVLTHGDVVNFGLLAYRFEMKNNPAPRALTVSSKQGEE